jgi:putative hemolysin
MKAKIEIKLSTDMIDLRNIVFKETYGVNDLITEYDEQSLHFTCYDDETLVGYYRLRNFNTSNIIEHSQASDLFDLSMFAKQIENKKLIELSRACVHPGYRDGKAITKLWKRIADYFTQEEIDYAFGVTSNKKDKLNDTLSYIIEEGLVLPTCIVPKNWKDIEYNLETKDYKKKNVTTLIRAYSKQGAKFCITPAYDPDWDSYDIFSLFDGKQITDRFKNKED